MIRNTAKARPTQEASDGSNFRLSLDATAVMNEAVCSFYSFNARGSET